MIQQVES